MRYWYKTKRPNKISGKREMRVFTQYPHGYDVYIGEKIVKDENGHFIHILFDRNTDRVIRKFDDHGNCGFSCSRDIIEQTLDPMLKEKNQLRKARRAKIAVSRKKHSKTKRK